MRSTAVANESVAPEDDAVSPPVSRWRIAKLILLGLTGIGAFWMLGRTYTVSPGKVATVTDTLTGKMRIIGPGMHILESPFASFNGEVPSPGQSIITRYNNLRVRTAEGVEITTGVDLRYTITDPIALAKAVDGPYKAALAEAISISLSNIISAEGITYSQLSSARASQMLMTSKTSVSGSDAEEKAVSLRSTTTDPQTSPANASINHLGALLLKKMQDFCASWGIKLSISQVVDPKATDPTVEGRYEESARSINDETIAYRCADTIQARLKIEAQGTADRLALSTEAEANRIKALANADAQRTAIATAAQVKRLTNIIDTIRTAPDAGRQIMAFDTQVAVAERLSTAKGMVFASPFNMFSQPQDLPAGVAPLDRKLENPRRSA